MTAPVPVSRVGPHRPDYLLLACTIALLVLGTLMVYSASFAVAHNEFHDDAYFLIRQLASVGVGSIGMLVAMRVDYRRLRFWSLLILLVAIALLILVLLPNVGLRSYGAVRWLRLGPIQVQPSEIAKLALVLYLADWMARRGKRVGSFFNGLLPFGVFVGVVAVLVELQPDLGTTAIIVGTAACVFFVAGANLVHISLLSAGGVGCRDVVAGAPERVSTRAHPRLSGSVERRAGQWLAHCSGPDRARLRRPVRPRARQWAAQVLLGAQRPHRRHLQHHRRGARVCRLPRRAGPVWHSELARVFSLPGTRQMGSVACSRLA